jgi:hypothetical protein
LFAIAQASLVLRQAFIAAVLAALTVAATATAFDRPPVSVVGLTPDGWGQSTTAAQRQLYARYPGISSVYCIGVRIPNYSASASSWVHGLTRYWDKLACAGYTRSTGNTVFVLIYDAKGANSWIIYRLGHVTVDALTTP